MRMVDLIQKKRDGKELTKEEINYIIQNYTNGDIPDYQMSAFAMAVYFQDMTTEERANLTMAMVESGDQIDLSAIEQLVARSQTRAIGDCLVIVSREHMNGKHSLNHSIKLLMDEIETRGLDVLSSRPRGSYAMPRRFEIAAAINRLRTLRVKKMEERSD